MAVGTACDVLSAFLVTFFTPYIQNGPQIQLGARTAFIWMSFSVVAFFFSFLVVPDLKVCVYFLRPCYLASYPAPQNIELLHLVLTYFVIAPKSGGS